MKTFITIIAVMLCLAAATSCHAGADFLVNSFTPGNQQSPAITTDGENYLVVWRSHQDNDFSGIYGRLYDEDGAPVTSEFQINTYTTGEQIDPCVASNGSNFLVTWRSEYEYGLSWCIVGQYLDNHGDKIGSPFQISTTTNALYHSLTSNGVNYFVIYGYNQTSSTVRITRRTIYSSTSLSTEYTLATISDETLAGTSIACSGPELCAVVETYVPNGGYYTNNVRSYIHKIAPNSTYGPLMVNVINVLNDSSYSTGTAAVAYDGTDFGITWVTTDYGTSKYDHQYNVCGRYVDHNNSRVGGEILITPDMPGQQMYPSICPLSNGVLMVSWTHNGTNLYDVRARSMNGTLLSEPQLTLNTRLASYQWKSAIASNGTTIMAVWQSDEHDGSMFAVSGNVYGKQDTDGDGLVMYKELTFGTSDTDADSDDDTLSDYAEVMTHGTNPLNDDTDNDMLRDAFEVGISGTNPTKPDSDEDGLEDFEEILTNTDPMNPDSDGDGLNDYQEVMIYDTDPNNKDSDSDGFTDYDEIIAGTDPNDGLDFLEITRFHELSAYLGTSVAFIGWNSAPRKVYRVYVQTDSVGSDFVLLEDDVESKGYETFYMDQGGGPNHILHPNDDPNPRLYRVVVKP
ncbi:MAG: hypothetical protein AB1454_12725 [Candidatus Auribacterota bacterium]